MYALNLDFEDDNRILSATDAEYGAEGQPLVDTLPEGDIHDYKYINGVYVYDPLPEPVPPEPVPDILELIAEFLLAIEKIIADLDYIAEQTDVDIDK